MSINSNRKGKVGERDWAKYLRDTLGLPDARRGQQFKGTPDSPDVVGGIPNTHCEVKRVEKLNINKAMEKASEDCGTLGTPYVAHRTNGRPWLVTLYADDIQAFAQSVLSIAD